MRVLMLVPALVLAVPWPAHALEITGCEASLAQALRAALVVELADADPDVAAALPSARLVALCGDTSIALRAEASDGRYAGQDVPLDVGAPRRSAIVLIELVRALLVTPTAPPSAPEAPARALLVASGGIAFLGEPRIVLAGGGLSLRLVVSRYVQLAVALQAGTGRLDVAPGRLSLAHAGGAVSVRLGTRAGPVGVFAGPLLSGEVHLWNGAARAPDVNTRRLVGPRVALGIVGAATFFVRERFALDLELSLDGGFVGSEARFDAEPLARTTGPSFGVRLGACWVLR